MNHAKIDLADLDPLCGELFVRSLGLVVARLVCWASNFSCASTGGVIQLYIFSKWLTKLY